ncbi:MAG: Zinc-ribbon containing domain [Methanothermococcus sp.]|jgi:exosome complex RNA-binding protein Csl4|uniref:DUF2614 family zinc ribbon-containing protein n=1 Tax=Methanothermococcus TaxID=155862 RepID=UPI00037453AB|nr:MULTISPECIES: DUF2614 family zinc ribbon-containing protein [Methanothermococcus]MDK2791015.1 Zinc-ribbon containing domain [Methanothermococcus sp.]MDK2988326.1 Zinc-ribbon containing domain [Methanothermococcus sp.]
MDFEEINRYTSVDLEDLKVIEVECPSCEMVLRVVGKKIMCPNCKRIFEVSRG